MRVHLHCRALAGRPRARFRFRSPYVSSFRLTEGTATVRLEADKPPGDVSPLGALRTNVRRAACTAAPGRPVITDATFTATARVTCDDLSAHARGSLALGGLLAPGGAGATATAAASPPATSASPDARAASACRPELNLTVVGRNVISAVRCDSNRRTIRPFETLRIPQDLDLGSCPDSEPSPWPLPPQTVHVEGDIPYSYALRLVTNWSLDRSGEVFLRYTCIKVPL
jgi:hypothetical protein